MYEGKARAPTPMPGWLDRGLILCWLPLIVTWGVPRQAAHYADQLACGGGLSTWLLDGVVAHSAWMAPLSALLVVGVHVGWALRERAGDRPVNWARRSMALGTSALSATFVFLDPELALLVYGFSHAVEYIVFVGAFSKRKYGTERPHRPWLGWAMKRPWLAMGVFTVLASAVFVWGEYYGGRHLFSEQPMPRLLVYKVRSWLLWWVVLQSMLHFYWDGFLWKMRDADVRAHV